MKRLLTCILFLLIVGAPAQAQDTGRKHWLGMGTSLARHVRADDQASPLRYSGALLQPRLEYGYEGIRNRHRLLAAAGPSRYTSSITRGELFREKGVQVQLQGAYGRRLASVPTGSLFAGFLIDSFFDFVEHRYTSTYTEFLGTYYTALNIEATGVLFERPSGRLVVRFALPVGALVLRPSYSLKGPVDYHLVTLDRFRRFSGAARYERRLHHRWKLAVGYEGLAYRIEDPVPYRSVWNGIHVGLSYSPF